MEKRKNHEKEKEVSRPAIWVCAALRGHDFGTPDLDLASRTLYSSLYTSYITSNAQKNLKVNFKIILNFLNSL